MSSPITSPFDPRNNVPPKLSPPAPSVDGVNPQTVSDILTKIAVILGALRLDIRALVGFRNQIRDMASLVPGFSGGTPQGDAILAPIEQFISQKQTTLNTYFNYSVALENWAENDANRAALNITRTPAPPLPIDLPPL